MAVKKQYRLRFTLIELLVVIAIVAILASFLLPALQSARDAAKKAACLSNERQVFLIVNGYSSDFDGYIPPWSTGADFRTDDYGEYGTFPTFLQSYDEGLTIDKWGNSGTMKSGIFVCPSDRDSYRRVGISDRRRVSYNGPYEMWKYIDGRNIKYGNSGTGYALKVTRLKRPDLSAVLADSPSGTWGKAQWVRDPGTGVFVTINGNLSWVLSDALNTMGVRLGHLNDRAFNLAYLDGHATSHTYPEMPEEMNANWFKSN